MGSMLVGELTSRADSGGMLNPGEVDAFISGDARELARTAS
jgi:hypothetical protein